MKANYCNWTQNFKKVIEEMSEAEAKRLHDKRELYYVVIGDTVHPYCYLQINNKFFNIGFLDENKRTYLRYEFSEIESGKLFLVEAQFFEFIGDTDKKSFSTLYFFEPNGKVTIQKVNVVTRQGTEEIAENVNLSENYESYPEFGVYEKLIVKERNFQSSIT